MPRVTNGQVTDPVHPYLMLDAARDATEQYCFIESYANREALFAKMGYPPEDWRILHDMMDQLCAPFVQPYTIVNDGWQEYERSDRRARLHRPRPRE